MPLIALARQRKKRFRQLCFANRRKFPACLLRHSFIFALFSQVVIFYTGNYFAPLRLSSFIREPKRRQGGKCKTELKPDARSQQHNPLCLSHKDFYDAFIAISSQKVFGGHRICSFVTGRCILARHHTTYWQGADCKPKMEKMA